MQGKEDHLELGYWIARSYWGLGFATEAGKAVVRIARAMNLPRLQARHFLDNPASANVLRKIGFRPTNRVVLGYSRGRGQRSEEHTSELQSLMRHSYAVFCLKTK